MVSLRSDPPQTPASDSWREVASRLTSHQPGLQCLSPAERVVAEYVLQGCTNKEIATVLGKSVSTVKNQVAACLAKFGVASRARFIVLLR
jgi:DNA-binding NarL/FixJ family response regulator